jgi:phosphoglycolate phosphatase
MKDYQLYIFDFDGTLADSSTLAVGLLNELAKIFRFKSIESNEEALKLRGLGTRQAIQYLQIPSWKLPLVVWKARRMMTERMTSFPLAHKDIYQSLKELKQQGKKLAILSSNSEKNIFLYLKHYQLDFFDEVKQSSLFGKAPKIKKIIKRTKTSFDQAVYIGDETRDIEAAKQAGVDSIAVSWGHNKLETLEASKPTHSIQSLKELLS